MANNTVFFPGYSAGENAYKEIDAERTSSTIK